MKIKETNNGKKGGTLKGKKHYDKNGKPLGGIKAVVTDTKQKVELESGEVIINAEASALHWKELDRINTSAGNGVHILPPDSVVQDADEYKNGGNLPEFNPNDLPKKHILIFADRIKNNYPKIWEITESPYYEEAFKNLKNVVKRGYWLDGEKWFYYKWKNFCDRHKSDSEIDELVLNLKWLNCVSKGWAFMKSEIEAEIKNPTKKKQIKTTELKKGIKVEHEHDDTYLKLYNHEITPKEAPKHIAEEHLQEDDEYYSKLAEIEGFANGGKIKEVMSEFYRGTLKTPQSTTVTDKKQALAIAISEQKKHENKLKLGGKTFCQKCGNSWYTELQSEKNCLICGHLNVKNYNSFGRSANVKFNKVNKENMEETNILFNDDIFTSIGDYILGGINVDDLNNWRSYKNDNPLNISRLQSLFEQRLQNAINNFKKEIVANLALSGKSVEKIDDELSQEFYNLFLTYLGKGTYETSTDILVEKIINHESYQEWVRKIEKKLDVYNRQIDLKIENVNKNTTKKVSVTDAEDATYNSTLHEILEQLFNITGENYE